MNYLQELFSQACENAYFSGYKTAMLKSEEYYGPGVALPELSNWERLNLELQEYWIRGWEDACRVIKMHGQIIFP